MKLTFKPNVQILLSIILLSGVQFNTILAQNNTDIKEPPVPIYVISPFHEDSITAADSATQVLSSTLKKLDTLQQQIQKSSAENTVHFIWLYTLIVLLGIMIIVILFSASRIHKEMVQLKRLEHRQMHLSSESSALLPPPAFSESTPTIQETSVNPEPVKKRNPVRRKTRIVKPRIKKQKKI